MNLLRGGLLLAVILSLLPHPAEGVGIGDVAPDFITADVNSGPYIVLSDHRGGVVCLIFFWTG